MRPAVSRIPVITGIYAVRKAAAPSVTSTVDRRQSSTGTDSTAARQRTVTAPNTG